MDWRECTAISEDGLWFFCILCGEWQSMGSVTEHGTCQRCEEYVDDLMELAETE